MVAEHLSVRSQSKVVPCVNVCMYVCMYRNLLLFRLVNFRKRNIRTK